MMLSITHIPGVPEVNATGPLNGISVV